MGPSETEKALAPGREIIPAPLPLTTARVGVGALVVFGDYQIAPKPPGGRLWLVAADAAGVWGTPPTGGTGSFTLLRGDTSSVTASPCRLSPCGSVRGSDRPPACHSIPRTPQGEGLGDKKKRPGALLLALFISFCLFISFWWRRSGRSGTGETGHRRGLRRGQRSWGCPWCRRP